MRRERRPVENRETLTTYEDSKGNQYTRFNWRTQKLPVCGACSLIHKPVDKGPCALCCALDANRRRCYFVPKVEEDEGGME